MMPLDSIRSQMFEAARKAQIHENIAARWQREAETSVSVAAKATFTKYAEREAALAAGYARAARELQERLEQGGT